MDNALFFALASLLCAGVNDLVFKKQATSGQGRGQYIAIVGTIWMLVFAGIAVFSGQMRITSAAVKWGLLAGTFSVVGNYLLIASLRHLDASVGATIYRLNLVLAALMAILFLGESLTWKKIVGLSLAGLAVILFAERRKSGDLSAVKTNALFMVIIASFLRAGMGISYKLAAGEFAKLHAQGVPPQHHWFLAIQGLMWVGMGLAVAARFEREIKLTRLNVGYGVFSGVLVCGIVLFLARALALGDASVIIPITQMSFLVTALLSWPLIRERFSRRKISALGLATAAILLLSLAL